MKYKEVKLGDVFEFVRNGTSIKQGVLEGGYPITRIETIWNSTIDIRRFGYAGITNCSLFKDFLLEKGDILLTHINSLAHLGKSAIYEGVPEKLIHGMNLLNMRPNKKILHPKYAFYYLKSPYFRSQIPSVANQSVNQSSITCSNLKGLKFILPSVQTQKKITEILDTADLLRQKDKLLIEKYNQLTQSLFLEMFGDPVRNEKGWEKGCIRDLVNEVKYGTSSKADEGGHYPYLRMNNITYEGYLDLSDLKYINLEDSDKHKYLIRRGDVLFNRTNSKELVGKTGIWNSDKEVAIAGYLIRVRTNEKANPYFIWGYLNSKHGKRTLENMCKSIVGMANINAQELQDIPILHPPVELQNRFQLILEEIEKQKQLSEANLKYSEALFNALLQKALNGELVKEDKVTSEV